MTEYSPAKTGNIRGYSLIYFQNCARCVKDWKNDKHSSLHLGRKYARIFVPGHYLFLEAQSFPRATLSENCSLLGTDNVCGQISEHIFVPNGGYCLYITKFGLYHATCLNQWRARRKYLMDSDKKYSVFVFVFGFFVFVFAFFFLDYHDMSFVSTAIDPHDVTVRDLVVDDFIFSPQTGRFDLNVTWRKPSFNYSHISSYTLSYQVNGRNKITTRTVGVELESFTILYLALINRPGGLNGRVDRG